MYQIHTHVILFKKNRFWNIILQNIKSYDKYLNMLYGLKNIYILPILPNFFAAFV